MSNEKKPAACSTHRDSTRRWRSVESHHRGAGAENWFAPIASVTKPGGARITTLEPEMTWPTNVPRGSRPAPPMAQADMRTGDAPAADYYLSPKAANATAPGAIRVRRERLGRLLRGHRGRLDLLPLQPAPLPGKAPGARAPDDLQPLRGHGAARCGLAQASLRDHGPRHRHRRRGESGGLGAVEVGRSRHAARGGRPGDRRARARHAHSGPRRRGVFIELETGRKSSA